MKKNQFSLLSRERRRKVLMVMRLVFIMLFACFMHASATVYSQNSNFNLNLKNETVEDVIRLIEEKSEFSFFYRRNHLDLDRKVDLKISNGSIKDVLNGLFKDQNVAYELKQNKLILLRQSKNALQSEIRKISGTVRDTKGELLPGVSVIVKGTTIGITTDVDGKYAFDVPSTAQTLRFSFMGMKPVELQIGTSTTIDAVMEENAIDLEEVVAIGYGTQKKADLTGAVTTVSSKSLGQRASTNLSTALQGAVSGVTVTRSGAGPGASTTIRIRGISSLQGSSTPLVLVDDVPVSSINDVNPDDIETYTVLKDAAAASIYGARAAAGVILITTKRAKKGELKMQYNVDMAVNVPTRTLDFVDAVGYFKLWNEKQWNDRDNTDDTEYSTYSKEFIDGYDENNANDPDAYPNTIWKDELLEDFAVTERHNFSVSGASKSVRSKVSFGYEHQDALYKVRDWKRYTLRLNNDFKLNEMWSAKVDASYFFTDQVNPTTYPLSDDLRRRPNTIARYTDGRLGFFERNNPLAALLEGGTKKSQAQKFNANLNLLFSPIDNLVFNFRFAPSLRNYYEKEHKPKFALYAADDHNNEGLPVSYVNKETYVRDYRGRAQDYTGQIFGTYKFNLGEAKFEATGGYEENYYKSENLGFEADRFQLKDYPYISNAPKDRVFWKSSGSTVVEEAYRSFFGRMNFSYASKYLLQVNARRDASSKFAKDCRWGTFPSVSGGWVISEESFFESLKSHIEFLKLRASYGVLGNDRLGNYLYQASLSTGQTLFMKNSGEVISDLSAYEGRLVYEDVTWETTTTKGLGLDITGLKNRLTVGLDLYQKETTDLLLSLNIPKFIGKSDPYDNVGSLETKGWELSASWRDRIGELGYSVSFHIDNNKTLVEDVKGKRIFSGNTLTEEGEEYRSLYGYVSDGIFQTAQEVADAAYINDNTKPGDVRYKDISGPEDTPDGKIDSYDKVHLGSSLPKFNYGGSLNFDYKRFDLGFVFQGVGKRNFVVSSAVYGFPSNLLTPTTVYVDNYWSHYNTEAENKVAEYPRLTKDNYGSNARFSDFWIRNGAYFRLKNITLGYTLPENITSKAGVSSLRLFVTANDLFTIDHLPNGIDPEQGYGSYFITKSFIIGAKIKF